MKTYHTFGCPVYMLNNDLASGKTIPMWSPRARLGINIEQKEFFGKYSMHYMASLASDPQDPDALHDLRL